MAPFYGKSSTVSDQSHYEDSLLLQFTTQSVSPQAPGVPGTHLINLGRMKG